MPGRPKPFDDVEATEGGRWALLLDERCMKLNGPELDEGLGEGKR
jgi:hypothetical protein